MRVAAGMALAVSRADRAGDGPLRWEMSVPAWNALMRELEPDRPPHAVVIGAEAPRPLYGLPVAIVPGPRIDWRLRTAAGRDYEAGPALADEPDES